MIFHGFEINRRRETYFTYYVHYRVVHEKDTSIRFPTTCWLLRGYRGPINLRHESLHKFIGPR